MKEMNGFKNETKGSSATTFSDISAYARRVNELYTAISTLLPIATSMPVEAPPPPAKLSTNNSLFISDM